MDTLNRPLSSSPTKHAAQKAIVHRLWGANISTDKGMRENGLESYFEYYTEQCYLALNDGGRHVHVRTHEEILAVVELIRRNIPRHEIQQTIAGELLPERTVDDRLIEASINLASRLLLMTDFGEMPFCVSGQRQVPWTKGMIKECLKQYWDCPQALSGERVKLENVFNARNLYRIAGIQVRWTSNLADHLRLMDDDKKVSIFHHAFFLNLQNKSDLFPDGFIDETIRTLALLFPESDTATQKWILKLPPSLGVDSQLIRCGHLRADDRHIDRFRYWRDRLVILKQAFDEAEPKTIGQWWRDRRKGVQWYTFWVALFVLLLTIFFGIIQCIEGALQVYKAFRPSPSP